MERQDPFAIKRAWRDEEMKKAVDAGEPLNNSAVTAFTLCSHPDCQRNVQGLKAALTEELGRIGWDVPVQNTKSVCDGTCPKGPYMGLSGLDIFYWGLKKDEVSEMLHETLFRRKIYFKRAAFDCLKSTDSKVIFDYKNEVMVPIEPDTCMVTLAKYLYDFNALESCGKCTPCRVGCFHVTEIMSALADGTATEDDFTQLEALLWLMDQGAYCEFAPKVASPILLTLANYKDEYTAHLEGGCDPEKCGHWGI